MKKINKFILITILIISTIGCSKENKPAIKEKEANNDKINTSISYYKKENYNRYLDYKNKNKNLSDEDIITYVNIGLDMPYYTNTKETPDLNKVYILSNKYLYMPSTYTPDNLTSINSEYTSGTKKLVSYAKDAFENLVQDAKKEGFTIRAISAYRSYQYQEVLYNKYVSQDGVEKADTYSARPGYSEHQTGLVVDIDNGIIDFNKFENTKEFTWMSENAYKYGFILRYPKDKESITGYTYESWHYRYVGPKIAKKIKDLQITLDEYYVKFIDK